MEDDTMMVIVLTGNKKFYNPKGTFMRWYNLAVRSPFSLLKLDNLYDVVSKNRDGHIKLRKAAQYINLPQILYVYEYDSTYEIIE